MEDSGPKLGMTSPKEELFYPRPLHQRKVPRRRGTFLSFYAGGFRLGVQADEVGDDVSDLLRC